MKRSFKKPWVKNVSFALAIAFFGFILLNITFLFDAVYQGAVRWIVRLFTPLEPETTLYWFPPSTHLSFVLIIAIISWFVFRSKLDTIYKAIYMVVPVAVMLVTLGMFFYRWPILVYSLGALLCIAAAYYLYRTKQPWLYYYAVILVGLILGIFTLTGGEI